MIRLFLALHAGPGEVQGVPHTVGIAAGIALLAAAAGLGTALSISRLRRRALRALGMVSGALMAAFLVIRGVAEFWVVHYANPASYRSSWGGPSLAGVFAVHTGPAVLVLVGAVLLIRRRLRKTHAPRSRPFAPHGRPARQRARS